MPSNERENARSAKKRKSEQRTKKIIWGLIIVIAAVLIIMKVAEVDYSAIKSKFVDSDGRLSISLKTDENAFPYNLDTSRNVKVTEQNYKLSVLTASSCTVLNPTDGKPTYSFVHGYANPIIKTAGNYFCLFDQGANRFRLDTLTGNVFETKSEEPILCADVSKNGNIIYATKSSESKSKLFIINSKLKTLLELDVNSGYIISVSIDSSGKKCAYAVVNTKDAKLLTTIYTINVGDKEERASFEYSGSDLLDMRYSESGLYAVFTNGVSVISSQKKQKSVFENSELNSVCFGYTSNGELIYVYSKYASANENYLVHINSSGKVKTEIELNQKPKAVTSSSNEICVLFSDKVAVYSLTKGEEKETFKCNDSIASANKLSTKVFISKHQVIDILE